MLSQFLKRLLGYVPAWSPGAKTASCDDVWENLALTRRKVAYRDLKIATATFFALSTIKRHGRVDCPYKIVFVEGLQQEFCSSAFHCFHCSRNVTMPDQEDDRWSISFAKRVCNSTPVMSGS
jgi:hypothetical protein